MPAAVVAAAFEDIEKPVEIRVGIGVRVDQRMPDARLGGEMDDEWKAVLGEQRRGGGPVRQIQPHELEILGIGKLLQPSLLQLRIVVRRQIVDANHLAARLHQSGARRETR